MYTCEMILYLSKLSSAKKSTHLKPRSKRSGAEPDNWKTGVRYCFLTALEFQVLTPPLYIGLGKLIMGLGGEYMASTKSKGTSKSFNFSI